MHCLHFVSAKLDSDYQIPLLDVDIIGIIKGWQLKVEPILAAFLISIRNVINNCYNSPCSCGVRTLGY